MTVILLLLAVFWAIAGVVLTGTVHRHVLRRQILDVPNDRSSHVVPTPRGGGLCVAGLLMTGTAVAALAGAMPPRLALALGVGGAAIAIVGGLDDVKGVRARTRAAVHFAAAGWALLVLNGLPGFRLGTLEVPLGIQGSVLGIAGIVWLTNLYNFMDGIDGLAASQAVSVGVGGAVLSFATGHPAIGVAALLVAASTAGFLPWNWHPAKIFMGDVGSSLLGYSFGVVAVASERAGGVSLVAWMVLMGVFVFDATATLLRRVATGQRWYEAHRNHAYQRAARSGLGHAAVTRGVLGVNAVLWALAAAGVWRPVLAVPCAAAGLAFLTGLYLWVERLSPMQGGGEKPVTVPGAGDVPGVVHGRRRHLRTTQTGRGTAARVPRARHRDDG